MSQNGTPIDEKRNTATSSTVSAPYYVPMMPMYLPYGAANTAAAQQFYAPTVYPGFPPGFGPSYNPFFGSFYHNPNGLLPPAHVGGGAVGPGPLMTRSLMAPTLSPVQLSAPLPSLTNGGTEHKRNQNLNIRECQSPVITQPKDDKKTTNPDAPIIRPRTDSSTSTSLSSHISNEVLEPDRLPPPHPPAPPQLVSNSAPDDFLTFIQRKTASIKPQSTAGIASSSNTMLELNPFANEFSFVKTTSQQNLTTTTTTTTTTTNGGDTSSQSSSSYRLMFDNLIEKSLESIEAMKKSSRKKIDVNHVSVQHNHIDDGINRSTQTLDNDHDELLQDYSSRTIKLMDTLLDNFKLMLTSNEINRMKQVANNCDELRHLIVFINHIVSSRLEHTNMKSNLSIENPFNDAVTEQLNVREIQPSPLLYGAGRGRRLPSSSFSQISTSHSPVPLSFSCRQIEPISIVRSKICSICHKSIDDNNEDYSTNATGFYHKSCSTERR